MRKQILYILLSFLVGMVGGIFADQILWPYFVERPLFYQYGLEQSPIYVTEKKEFIIQENTALKEAIVAVENTLIGVRTETVEGEVLEGSGFVVTADGLIITLADLVPQGSDFSFYVKGKRVSYNILKRDIKENLALVEIEAEGLGTRGFADLDKVKLGERVFLIGATFVEDFLSVQPGYTGEIVNEGIVKKMTKDLILTNITEDVSLKGSPLFNISGEVLGINMVNEKGEVLAIPVSKIREFTGL